MFVYRNYFTSSFINFLWRVTHKTVKQFKTNLIINKAEITGAHKTLAREEMRNVIWLEKKFNSRCFN